MRTLTPDGGCGYEGLPRAGASAPTYPSRCLLAGFCCFIPFQGVCREGGCQRLRGLRGEGRTAALEGAPPARAGAGDWLMAALPLSLQELPPV